MTPTRSYPDHHRQHIFAAGKQHLEIRSPTLLLEAIVQNNTRINLNQGARTRLLCTQQSANHESLCMCPARNIHSWRWFAMHVSPRRLGLTGRDQHHRTSREIISIHRDLDHFRLLYRDVRAYCTWN
jgi:hypothetical protein